MPVKVVTDSVSDLPPRLARELGITIVPLHVRFGENVYRDGVDLTIEQFYRELAISRILPVTSVPAPADYAEAYDSLAQEADGILVITVSARLSGTFDVARQSVGLMKRKCRVEVVDSRWAVMAEGFIAMAAARAALAGATLDEVLEVVRTNIPRVDMRAAFDTLEYLRRGGRIGAAQALLGSALHINPIITMRDGLVEPAGRARSRTRAMDHLLQFALGYSRIEEVAVEEGACPDDADRLVEQLSARTPADRIYRTRITPVIGTHTGPGLLMLSIMGDK
jgi:DegV family protein with EDD domain